MFKTLAAASLALLMGSPLSGCASTKYNYLAEMTEISEPPLDSVNTRSIGEALLRQGRYVEAESLYLPSSVKVGLVGTYTLGPGYYTKVGENDVSSFFKSEFGPEGGRVSQNPLADPFESVQVYKDKRKICGVSVMTSKACKEDAQYELTKRASLTANSFQRSLLYNGKHGSKINIGPL